MSRLPCQAAVTSIDLAPGVAPHPCPLLTEHRSVVLPTLPTGTRAA